MGKGEVMKLNESRGKKNPVRWFFFSFQINEKVIRRGVKWFSPSFAADDLLFVSYSLFFNFFVSWSVLFAAKVGFKKRKRIEKNC